MISGPMPDLLSVLTELRVATSLCCIEDVVLRRVVQNCDGACTQGYYCPAGSTVANVSVCGNLTVVCPAGSGAPTVVLPGNYSAGGASNATMVAQLPCPAGSYCVAGQQNICPVGRYGNVNTGSSTVCNNTCPDGYQW